MRLFKTLLFIPVFCFLAVGLLAQADAEKGKDKKKKPAIKSFEDFHTDDMVSQEGLFNIHQSNGDFYFELPNDLLGKELLVVSRISGHVQGLNFGGAGMKSRPQQVIRWERKHNQVLLRSVSYNSVANFEDPVYRSLRNNNFEPVIASMKIEAYGKDSTAVIIKANPLFTTDVPMIGALRDSERKRFGVKGLDSKRSMVDRVKAFPKNVEVRHILTYRGDKLPDNKLTGTLSIGMNQSFIELPEETWQPRLYDGRVGYFSLQQIDYSLNEQRAGKRRYITRWRLEPSDPEAYRRGEAVEPVKQIVYYLDPGTPEKWRPYLKQGVEDWQDAFEKAGFKNAIIAKDAPTPEEDPDWSPEDVRYSVIRYITTDIQNAQGPHVHDPRTGEILESDILWYHNVMNLLRNWFFIQTAAINPEARGPKFKDEVMGELIRFVAAHEVGHTLGLPHNMGSSPAYPVDSLRSPTFTATHGTAPSIMDYARFNYIAQPEDGVTNFYPGIGTYDDWSIYYGYRLNLDAKTPEADHKILNEWIKEHAGDPEYRYGQQRFDPADPSAQTEDLGDDAVYASEMGIANLKRILPQLPEWATIEGQPYTDMQELYNNVVVQLGRYMRHVGTNIGGVYEYRKTTEEDGIVFHPVPRDKQVEALNFLDQQLFQTPTWLVENDILRQFENSGSMERIRRLQEETLTRIFEKERLLRLNENGHLFGQETYDLTSLFEDSRRMIFSELRSGKTVDPFRRNLQRTYVDQMHQLLQLEGDKYDQSDIKALARGTLLDLEALLKKKFKSIKDDNKFHFQDLMERIEDALE